MTTFEERNKRNLEKADRCDLYNLNKFIFIIFDFRIRRQKEAEQVNDAVTGKPLFKPKTGRAPKSIVIF